MDKEKFRIEAKQLIDNLVARIDELESKKENIKAGARKELEETLDTLKSKKELLKAKYDELTGSSEDKWEEAKEVFSSASESFKEGLGKIASLFK